MGSCFWVLYRGEKGGLPKVSRSALYESVLAELRAGKTNTILLDGPVWGSRWPAAAATTLAARRYVGSVCKAERVPDSDLPRRVYFRSAAQPGEPGACAGLANICPPFEVCAL